MATAKLRVSGLEGAHGEAAVEKVLGQVRGVYGVVASCTEGCVEIDFEDDEVTIREIIAAASAAGYEATLAG